MDFLSVFGRREEEDKGFSVSFQGRRSIFGLNFDDSFENMHCSAEWRKGRNLCSIGFGKSYENCVLRFQNDSVLFEEYGNMPEKRNIEIRGRDFLIQYQNNTFSFAKQAMGLKNRMCFCYSAIKSMSIKKNNTYYLCYRPDRHVFKAQAIIQYANGAFGFKSEFPLLDDSFLRRLVFYSNHFIKTICLNTQMMIKPHFSLTFTASKHFNSCHSIVSTIEISRQNLAFINELNSRKFGSIAIKSSPEGLRLKHCIQSDSLSLKTTISNYTGSNTLSSRLILKEIQNVFPLKCFFSFLLKLKKP